MSRSSLFAKSLLALGVEQVFGVPGTQSIALFEALRGSAVRVTTATSETGAGFMANGYYRASGRPGVVLAIPGPGFTCALTPLAEARADSVGLVLITSLPPDGPHAAFQLQAIDQAAIAGPLVKSIIDVREPADLPGAVSRAVSMASEGEPGPILVQLDPKVMAAAAETGHVPSLEPPPSTEVKHHHVQAMAERLRQSRRSVLLLGQGCADASLAARRVAERLGAPVLTTPSGRGILPEDHPLAMGFDPNRGATRAANELLASADLVVAFGAKLGHNGTAGFNLELTPERFMHVDASAEVLEATYPALLAVQADCTTFMPALAGELDRGSVQSSWRPDEVTSWRARCRHPESDSIEPLLAARSAAVFFQELRSALGAQDVLVTDTGLHQVLVRRHFDVLRPRGLLLPSDYQSMGFGIPAAVGAALAEPAGRVVAVVGDGGFAMTGMGILAAARDRIPLTVIVFNDGHLNLIRMNQISAYGRATDTRVGAIDFEAAANMVGARYLLYGARSSARDLEQVLGGQGPALVEVPVRDGAVMRRHRYAARSKSVLRGLAGDTGVRLLKRLIRRTAP